MLLQALTTLIRALPPDHRAALTDLLAGEDTDRSERKQNGDSGVD